MKFIFFISIYNIIIKYNKLYYIYQLQFYYTFNFIFKSFFLHFYNFWSILGSSIFYVKISVDVSVKWKYRYIRNYRYFHPWSNLVYWPFQNLSDSMAALVKHKKEELCLPSCSFKQIYCIGILIFIFDHPKHITNKIIL